MKRLSAYFYFRYWLYKTFGECVFKCCIDKHAKMSRDDGQLKYLSRDPTLDEAIEYFEALENAVKYHVSIKRECVEDLKERLNKVRKEKDKISKSIKNKMQLMLRHDLNKVPDSGRKIE